MDTKTAEELLAAAREINEEIEDIRLSKPEDDYDFGFREGAIKSLFKINEILHNRIEKLIRKEDSNGSSYDCSNVKNRLSRG